MMISLMRCHSIRHQLKVTTHHLSSLLLLLASPSRTHSLVPSTGPSPITLQYPPQHTTIATQTPCQNLRKNPVRRHDKKEAHDMRHPVIGQQGVAAPPGGELRELVPEKVSCAFDASRSSIPRRCPP
mmetsp:Transcript_918/g.3175  ORF Transcript_918/g.3175 Transcript_918/m.3175 type:complete len:127 (+) Transcript_918:2079-2459(+)